MKLKLKLFVITLKIWILNIVADSVEIQITEVESWTDIANGISFENFVNVDDNPEDFQNQ